MYLENQKVLNSYTERPEIVNMETVPKVKDEYLIHYNCEECTNFKPKDTDCICKSEIVTLTANRVYCRNYMQDCDNTDDIIEEVEDVNDTSDLMQQISQQTNENNPIIETLILNIGALKGEIGFLKRQNTKLKKKNMKILDNVLCELQVCKSMLTSIEELVSKYAPSLEEDYKCIK